MQTDLLLAFVLIFALDSLTPGPAVALVMSRGASVGLPRTMPLIVGLVLGDLFLFVLALAGLAALAAALGPYFIVVKWLGVFYLLFLAYRLWGASLTDASTKSTTAEGWRSFGLGIVLPLANPKAVGFYAALLPAFMDVSELSFVTALEFGLAIVLIWGSVLIGYSALADRGRRRFTGSSVQKWINRGSAGALLGVAGTIALRE